MSTSAHNSISPPLLQALGGARPARTPVWFMRQAGRSLPEYRALRSRAGLSMLDVCLTPELAAEATLQPVRRHGVDAAVFFSDIMVPLRLAGVDVRIEPGVGPVLGSPVRTRADIEALTRRVYGQDGAAGGAGGHGSTAGPDGAAAIADGVRAVVAELGAPGSSGTGTPTRSRTRDCPTTGSPAPAGGAPPQPAAPTGRPLTDRELAGLEHSRGVAGWTPVIGFGGAPFTLAAYLVEGRPSRDHLAARTLMHSDPAAWDALMTWCATLTGEFITTQVEAGAAAAQLFDSWAGSLSSTDYRERVAPYSALVIERARQAVSPTTGAPAPLIHFGTGTARLLADMHDSGAQAVGVDDRTDLGEAIEALAGSHAGVCPVQGNVDPALLAAPAPVLARAVEVCLQAGLAAPGHVVNLGHGVPPGTDPAVLTRLVAQVHGDRDWDRVADEPWDGPQDADPGAGDTPAAATASDSPVRAAGSPVPGVSA